MSSGPKATLPNSKGTELWPSVTQQPVKLIIPGTEHDEALRQQVIAEFAGHLSNFHAKSIQQYALSPVAVFRQHYHLPDAKMTYTNVQGNETLQLDVHPSKLSGRRPVDWVLVEVDCPNAGILQGSMQAWAYLTSPVEQVIDTTSQMPFPGVAWNDYIVAAPMDRFLNAPKGAALVPITISTTEQRASFLLDARQLHTWPMLSIEIYAYFPLPDNPPTPIQMFNQGGPDTISPPPGVSIRDFMFTNGRPAYPQGNVFDPWIDFYLGQDDVYRIVASNTNAYLLPSGSSIKTHGVFNDGTPVVITGPALWEMYTVGRRVRYAGTLPVPGTVDITTFRGKLDPTPVAYIGSGSYAQWEFPSYGGRGFTPHSTPVALQGFYPSLHPETNLADHFAAPLLGKVTINNEQGSVTFKPA